MPRINTYKLYLDWFNNFITPKRCAEYYGITLSSMYRIMAYYYHHDTVKIPERYR